MLKFLKNLVGMGPSFVAPYDAHPTLGPATAAARKGDVRPLMGIFTQTGHDPALRYMSVKACSESYLDGSEHAPSMFDAWVKNSPNDVFGRLVRAALLLKKVPGYNPDDADAAEKVAEGDRLRGLAANDIQVAQSLAPEDAIVATYILDGQAPHERDEDLYESIIARAPTLHAAHYDMFWAHTERWGGESDDALTFARELAARMGGTELPLYVMYAHWERHWYLESMCDDEAGARAVLTNPSIRNECLAAYQATLGGPQHTPGVYTWWSRQLAARWFFLAGRANSDANDIARARAEIERLGNVFVQHSSHFWWMSNSEYAGLRTELGIAN